MTIQEIYNNAKKMSGALYYEIPFMPEFTISGCENITGAFETITVLNPDFRDDIKNVIKYLSEGENLTKERAKMDAIYAEQSKATQRAEIQAEDLFEETNIEIDGETLYRRK